MIQINPHPGLYSELSAVTGFGFGEQVSVLGIFNSELRITLWFRFHQRYVHSWALADLRAAESI